eukprot:scaffold6126_cov121-Skeletonema_dohrnii-CCMP3373.AAC.3
MGRKRSRDEQEEEVHVAKKPLRHRATVVGRNGNVWVVSTTRPPVSVSPSNTESDSTSSVTRNGGKSSSVSKQLHSWARMKEGKQHQIHNVQEKRSNISDSDSTKLQHAHEDSRATTPTNAFAYGRRQNSSVILCQTVLFFVLIIFFLVSIMYTLNVSHNLQMLKNDSMHLDTIDKYNTILQERERKYQHTKSLLNTAEDKAKQSQLTITRIVEEMTESESSYKTLIEDYKAIAQQHDDDKNDALSRISALRSQKEDSSSALDLVWLRMDDLLQENNDLSSQLKLTKKKLNNIKHLTLERDNLLQRRDVLEERNKKLQAQSELQQYTHEYTMNLFFAPMLGHTLNLQHTSEHQHSIIVDLTSIVRDLHESLENRETDLDTQIVFAHAQSKVHEIERVSLVQSMEAQLQQLEEEAVGAVNAVATASGKLEFERKSEEQTRWNEYVSQVESILGDMSSETGDGIIETSELRAAITRRVESGLNALKKYVHPNHFVNKKDDDSLFNMQIES